MFQMKIVEFNAAFKKYLQINRKCCLSRSVLSCISLLKLKHAFEKVFVPF